MSSNSNPKPPETSSSTSSSSSSSSSSSTPAAAAAKPKQTGKFRPKARASKPKAEEPSPPQQPDYNQYNQDPQGQGQGRYGNNNNGGRGGGGGRGYDNNNNNGGRGGRGGRVAYTAPRGKVVMGALSPAEQKINDSYKGGAGSSSSSGMRGVAIGAPTVLSATGRPIRGVNLVQPGQVRGGLISTETVIGEIETDEVVKTKKEETDSDFSEDDDDIGSSGIGGKGGGGGKGATAGKAGAKGKAAKQVEYYTYFSDSDSDDEFSVKMTEEEKMWEPRQLPLGVEGLTSAVRKISVKDKVLDSDDDDDDAMNDGEDETEDTSPANIDGPFLIASASASAKKKELESLLLIRLPSRLPELKKLPKKDDDEEDNEDSSSLPKASKDGVVNNDEALYDDSFKKIPAGLYGKINVYKSGRSEFIIGGGSGGKGTVMEVDKGLQCSFLQQVCLISSEGGGEYVEIGEIGKGVVVSPKLYGL